jgi:serine/threonine-protein kinase
VCPLGKTLFGIDPAAADDPDVGRILAGRYQLLRRLGSGQMAHVYVANQMAMERNVALKLLHRDVELDDVAVGRFRQEMRIAARLRSPHTITCHDAGVSEAGSPFIAMELLAGETLRQRLEREVRIPGHEVVAIAAQIGESLLEAHDAGIVHRDLKPENVFLCAHPTPLRPFVKVLDFGLAKLLDPADSSPRLTAERQTVGTPAYMAPEQIVRERPVDHRADVYALGVMCFEMLTGRRPYEARTAMQMVLAHVTQPIPRGSSPDLPLPAAVDAFFEQVMAKEAARRPARATDVAALLARALRGPG